MGRGRIIAKNLLLIAALAAYVAAAAGPLWGLGWESLALPVWSALIIAMLAIASWRFLRPGRSYPKTDIEFILPLILALNLFSTLLGPGGNWVKPMDYLLVALCALYYPLRFNLVAAGLIFLLDALNISASPGRADMGQLVNLSVFGAYLTGTALVLGRLFQSEHKKRERAVMAFRRLEEGTEAVSVKSISPEGRTGRSVEFDAELDGALEDLLEAARRAVSAENALLFMRGSDGEGVYLRVCAGGGGVVKDAVIAPGQGLVGWVVKEKKPLLVHEKARGLGYLKKEDGVSSFLAAPILDGGVLEGVIALDSPEKEAFDETDRETASCFASVALYLLQSVREFRQVDLTAKNFKALHGISSEMSSSLDLATILERLAELCRDIIPYDYLTVSFMDGAGGATFKVLKGYDGVTPPGQPVPLAGSLLGWIVDNRHQLFFTDMDQRSEKLPIFSAKELQTDCRSFLGIPFINQDRVLGVFTVALRKKDAISAYQQHMVSIIANQVAVNIANARLHQTIKLMATTDGLTGLINHRHFQEKADEKFARATRFPEPISILLFDIDHFKKVNDTFGHPIGDAVLKRVARILKDAVRSVDIAARYGGEEFVTLLENTDEKGAVVMAERIRAAVEGTKFVFDGKGIAVTISVGVASFPQDAGDKKGLIEKSDQALYWAKGHGRNQYAPYSGTVGRAALKNS